MVSDESESDDESHEDDVYETKQRRSHKRTVKTGTTIFVPHDVLKSQALVSSATRNKITPTAMSATLHALIEACDGETSAVNIHPTTAYRYKLEAANSIVKSLEESWKPPPVGLVHWDGKLMDTLDNSGKEERLPVLLSGIGGTKLLGVPALPHKSSEPMGTLIAKATCEVIQKWNCEDCVSGMVFDTTSANTGTYFSKKET